MLTLRCIQDSSSDYEEDEFETSEERTKKLADALFVNDDEIDEKWISNVELQFSKMNPSDQHDICYCLVSRLIRSIKFFLLEKKNTVNILIGNSDQEQQIPDEIDENEEDFEDSGKDPLEGCEKVNFAFEAGLNMLQDEDSRPVINNSRRENPTREIARLTKKLNKWRRIARERLSQLEEDIDFRNRLITSLTNNNH